eukprot:1159859-Pelagomonas_calceolata.AAC.4
MCSGFPVRERWLAELVLGFPPEQQGPEWAVPRAPGGCAGVHNQAACRFAQKALFEPCSAEACLWPAAWAEPIRNMRSCATIPHGVMAKAHPDQACHSLNLCYLLSKMHGSLRDMSFSSCPASSVVGGKSMHAFMNKQHSDEKGSCKWRSSD